MFLKDSKTWICKKDPPHIHTHTFLCLYMYYLFISSSILSAKEWKLAFPSLPHQNHSSIKWVKILIKVAWINYTYEPTLCFNLWCECGGQKKGVTPVTCTVDTSGEVSHAQNWNEVKSLWEWHQNQEFMKTKFEEQRCFW